MGQLGLVRTQCKTEVTTREVISDGRVFGMLFCGEFLLDELVSVELLLRDGRLKA